MSGEARFATGVVPAGTCRIGNTELTRVEEKGIGIGDVELFFFFHQTLSLVGQGLEKPFPQGRRHVFAFFGGKMESIVAFVFDSFQTGIVVVLCAVRCNYKI